MEYGWEFFWSVAASSAGTTILLGAAGWLLRTKISHWLNRDLEAAKAQHQRDLESYKVTLIATVERAKAAQEVKRTGAVKVLEMEFAAIQQFEVARRNLATDTLSKATLQAGLKDLKGWQTLMDRLENFREVSALLGIFLVTDQRQVLLNLRSALLDTMPYCKPETEPPAEQELSNLQLRVLGLDIQIDSLVDDLVKRMRSLD